jgi:hypothetical protein
VVIKARPCPLKKSATEPSRAPQHPTHRCLHQSRLEPVQQLLEGLKNRTAIQNHKFREFERATPIWDASSGVAALDSVAAKYGDRDAAVTFSGLDKRSAEFHERLTGQFGG